MGKTCLAQRNQFSPRFSLKPIQSLLVLGELFRKDFDRDVSAEFRIPRSVDLAHTAFADGLENLVMGEFVTSFE